MKTWIGIDFSGNDQMWSAGTTRSNVWISTLEESRHGDIRIRELCQVQALSRLQNETTFQALTRFLRDGRFDCAAIDAPFSLPREALPKDGFRWLMREVALLEVESGRRIPHGRQLIELARRKIKDLPHEGRKSPRRVVESHFGATRTPLWNGARGGAAFSVACMRLLADIAVDRIWSGEGVPVSRLVEAYPSAQLHRWNLPRKGYDGEKKDAPRTRRGIVRRVVELWRLKLTDETRHRMEASADALDAVLCAFGARAAGLNRFEPPPKDLPREEGWIAIHPPP